MLNYRKLQLHSQKNCRKGVNFKEMMALTQPEESESPIQELEEKKNTLQSYFLDRIKQNPDEEAFIRD